MSMNMDLISSTPRNPDGDLLKAGGITLHFHEHVDLHITVVRPEQRMEIEGSIETPTGELPMTHPANVVDAGEMWLMKNHPEFAKYAAKLRRELEAGPTEAEGEPTDEAENEEQEARRGWWRRKPATESVA